uniref:CRISPR-associated protein Cas6 C-terminal domain-containing protein n=1 Tax=uncultured Thiotrichaceae bacterium TaxID=298394 RepID=A0A6S6U5F7_9GAMM|nr:MAG: Unknown protein [uncultured Thiotrichaceae bacterium]
MPVLLDISTDTEITLPLSVYRFEYEALDKIMLPEQPGVLWHSQFGKTLRNLVCIVKNTACEQCLFLHQCDYTRLFQGTKPPDTAIMRKYNAIPSPHIIQSAHQQDKVIAAGETLSVDIVLPGQANTRAATLIKTLYHLGQHGLGYKNGRINLKQVTQYLANGQTLELLSEGSLAEATAPQIIPIPVAPETCRISLLTPYKPSGNAGSVDISRYLMAIIRRVDLIQYFYTGQKLQADFPHLKTLTQAITVTVQSVRKEKGQRYSAALGKLKDTSGFVGHIDLDLRECEELWPFLWVGQWLGVGKNASMGFGQYQVS